MTTDYDRMFSTNCSKCGKRMTTCNISYCWGGRYINFLCTECGKYKYNMWFAYNIEVKTNEIRRLK